MKIAVLPSWYLPDGAYFIKEQALFLKDRGLEVDMVSNLSTAITTHGWKYLSLPLGDFSQVEDGLLTYRRFTRYLPKSEQLNVRRWIRGTLQLFDKYLSEQGRPDLIHVHSAMWGGYAAALIKERYQIPYIITEHLGIMALQCPFSEQQFPAWKDRYFRKAFSEADYIIPVSEQLMRKIGQYKTPDVPWRAISNIVDTDFFHYQARKPKQSGTCRFVCINGFYPEKGYDVLLRAFDLFCESGGRATLTIAGENFDQQDFLQIWKKCVHRDQIELTGELSRQEVRALLWNSDVFLLSSRVESQSISALEAMSTGLPVVCTEVVPDFMTPDYAGYRVKNEDEQSLATAMLKMSKSYSLFDSEKISKHIRSIAHKDVILDQILSIYREILLRR